MPRIEPRPAPRHRSTPSHPKRPRHPRAHEVTMKPYACRAASILAAALLTAVVPAAAQDVPNLDKTVTVHTLENGWTFIIYERPSRRSSPSRPTSNVGSAQEVPGITGLAHMFEHMAFKGTPNIGTNDFKGEKAALDKIDQAYAAYDTERRKPVAGRREGEAARAGVEEGPGRRRQVRRVERVRRHHRPRRRRGPERRHGRRLDDLLLLAALQQGRAVGLSRIGAVPPPGLPRVLQGA